MTFKEIAETAGCSVLTVKRFVADKYPGRTRKGKVTRFTYSEATEIMEALPKRNMVGNLDQKIQKPKSNDIGDRLDRLEQIVERLAQAVTALVAADMQKKVDGQGGISWQHDPWRRLGPPIGPVEEAPPLTMRMRVNMAVRSMAAQEGRPQEWVWNDLYRQYDYRQGHKVKVLAENRGCSPLDVVEGFDDLGVLLAIINEGESDGY